MRTTLLENQKVKYHRESYATIQLFVGHSHVQILSQSCFVKCDPGEAAPLVTNEAAWVDT